MANEVKVVLKLDDQVTGEPIGRFTPEGIDSLVESIKKYGVYDSESKSGKCHFMDAGYISPAIEDSGYEETVFEITVFDQGEK
jgi:hypothetical protein